MSILSKIQALITAANNTTGESDTTLTDAVQTLVDGYGQGGGGSPEIPSYWKSVLTTAINTINGRSGFQTAFLTDIHWEDNNRQSPALLNEIMLRTAVNSAVCGGDLIVQQPTKASAIAMMENVVDTYSFADMAYCVGNHDLNSEESNDTSVYLTYEELEDIIGNSGGVTWYQHSSGDSTLFGYRDHADEKIREVFLNTSAPTLSGDDSHFSTALAWAYDGLKSLPSDWGVIIYAHKYWQPTGHMVTQNPAQYITGYLNSRMSQISAEIIAIITGHCHDDYYTYDPDYGYLILSTTTDSGAAQAGLDEVNPTRTPGTTLEQAFDVITVDRANKMLYATRIGAGSSRALPYYYLASYTVTGNYTNVTNSNQATSVQSGAAYTATLAAASGYEMQSVSITMGGVDITSTAYSSSTGEISIASVTGNIVITAIAEASKPTWTNLVPSALSTTGAVYNATGYKDGKYLSNTTATLEGGDDANFTLTGRIPYSQADFAAGKIICISGIDWTTDDHCRFIMLQTLTSANSTPYCKGSVTTSGGAQNIRTYFTLTQYSDYWTLTPIVGTVTTTALQYIAFSLKGSGANLSIGVINP